MTGSGELHAVFGTGRVGLAVMDELLTRGKRVRMVNRSSKATLPEEVELVNGKPVHVRLNCRPMTEDMPHAAHTRKGKVRARMAEELLAAHESGKVRAVIGRASDFFGPRVLVSAMGERVFPPTLASKAVQVVGNPDMAQRNRPHRAPGCRIPDGHRDAGRGHWMVGRRLLGAEADAFRPGDVRCIPASTPSAGRYTTTRP